MARSPSKKDDRDSRSVTPTPATHSRSPSPSPSSSSASSSAARNAASAAQARAFQEAKAISEQRQREIESVRNRTEHMLSGTPANLRNQVIDTVTHIEASKPLEATKPQQKGRNRLRDAVRKQTRKHQLGALTETKPARDARRSPYEVRAILKCKSRPKNNKRPGRGGGGGGLKRFIPWC